MSGASNKASETVPPKSNTERFFNQEPIESQIRMNRERITLAQDILKGKLSSPAQRQLAQQRLDYAQAAILRLSKEKAENEKYIEQNRQRKLPNVTQENL